jgi:mannose-1-phosphate guanylyltransferase
VGDNNLLQDTCHRLRSIEGTESAIIVCNEDHRFQVAESLRKLNINDGNIILEPLAKNTAPAIALAAFCVLEKNENGLMLVLAADHHIKNIQPLAEGIE